MPFYEYLCDNYGTRYQRLVFFQDQTTACPKCSSQRHTLQLSVFGTRGKSAARGNSSEFSSEGCGCTPKTCGCN